MTDADQTQTTIEPTPPTKHEQTPTKPRKEHKTRRQDHEDRGLDALKAGGKVNLGQASRPVLTHNERVSLDDLPAKVADFVATVKADNIGLANVELSIYWKPQWKPSPTGKDISVHYAILP
jgi:hypothetical protein